MGVLTGSSWVASAQDPELGRPLAALPFCVFRHHADERARVAVGIGDQALDLSRCAELDLLHMLPPALVAACRAAVLNPLIACGPAGVAVLRRRLTALLGSASNRKMTEQALLPLEDAHLSRPVNSPNFTDFYASREHAENVGRLFRPEAPLLPNYGWVPIGYHGRASSIVVSGTAVRRPRGQVRAPEANQPTFQPTAQMDYEAEIGVYVYGGNPLGEPVRIDKVVTEQVFGVTLLNDWSARDLQAWEYQPLGPFLGKSFATSVGGWVMPWAALEPYRVPARARATGEPEPLAYLRERGGTSSGLDLIVEALLETAQMRERGIAPVRLGRSSMAGLYWTVPQMIAHHTSNGCNLLAGDLLGTGAISGPGEDERGCLLEITRRGATMLELASGERRVFLEDGDTVILRAQCEREGLPAISLGECCGTVTPAHDPAG